METIACCTNSSRAKALKHITIHLSSLLSPLQPAESAKEGSVAPVIGCREDMIVKLIKTAASVEGSSTLKRWKPFLVFPEFLPACSVSSLEEHCGVPEKDSP